jgi:hypothetical protein
MPLAVAAVAGGIVLALQKGKAITARDDCTTNNAYNAHTAHIARDTVSLRPRLSRRKCRDLDFRLEHREIAFHYCGYA